jgi:hypothetical protein
VREWHELANADLDSFVPLLRAEHEEEVRLFNLRMSDWTETKLKAEGFMLEGMRGSYAWQPRVGPDGKVASFTVGGKGNTELPFHKFT